MSHQIDDVSLLLRTDSARQYNRGSLARLQEKFLEVILRVNSNERRSSNYDGVLFQRVFFDVVADVGQVCKQFGMSSFFDLVLHHDAIKQTGGHADVDCCLDLVSCQHPHFYACTLHKLDCVCHLVLQSVFNCS